MMIRVLLLLLVSMTGCKPAKPPDSRQVPAAQQDASSPDQDSNAGFPKGVLVKGPGFVGVIFPANSKAIRGLYPQGVSFWTPSESDVLAAEKGLVPFLRNLKNPRVAEILKGIETYKRQYRGVILGGHKQIFVRFFCETSTENWTSHEIIVLDGGSCFFNLRFSIATKTYSHLWINGEA
jgi:hypothetical protein